MIRTGSPRAPAEWPTGENDAEMLHVTAVPTDTVNDVPLHTKGHIEVLCTQVCRKNRNKGHSKAFTNPRLPVHRNRQHCSTSHAGRVVFGAVWKAEIMATCGAAHKTAPMEHPACSPLSCDLDAEN